MAAETSAYSESFTLEARFLAGGQGPVFAVDRRPAGGRGNRGVALILPPFAEEMNRARRFMTALGAGLAAADCHACLLDPYGTGDSAGEFSDASWGGWLGDIAGGVDALREEHAQPVWLIGIRTGALLALEAACATPAAVAGLLLIQPVTNGRQFLRQFLRLRIAANMRSGIRESTQELMQQLEAGDCVEVAGYALSGALALPLAESRMDGAVPPACPVLWYELTQDDAGDRAGLLRPPEGWPADVAAHRLVVGDAFWQIEEPPAVPQAVIDAVVRDLAEQAA